MSNTPNGQQNPDLLRLLNEIKGLVGNEGLVNWLSRHVVLGNLLFALLAGYSGLNIFERFTQKSVDPDLVSKKYLCTEQLQGFDTEDFSGANPSNTEISSLPVRQGLSATNLVFGCRYESSEKGSLQDVYMQLQAIPEKLILAQEKEYIEREIEEKDLDAVCRNERFFLKELEKRGRSRDEYKITPEGVKFDYGATNVYPVFRWECSYAIGSKDQSEEDGFISKGSTELIGLDLDKYHCEETYGKDLSKATYHDYNDPYSWYCANPNASRQ